MPKDPKQHTRRRIQILFGLLLAGIFYAEFMYDGSHEVVLHRNVPVAQAAVTAPLNTFEDLVRRQPLKALIQARERLDREGLDYTCIFIKQECINDAMTAEQEIEVKFRPQPYSVMMNWLRNPGLAQRVLYVKNKWIDEDADHPDEREQAVCQPAKGLSLFIKSIKQPIRGTVAQRTSRRSIDEFGFRRALDLLVLYSERAHERNELSLEFIGETSFDGRSVWLIRRHLPYTGEDGEYPDRVADIYLDRELHIPIAVHCFADDRCRPEDLLGKYEYRSVRFGQGLTDRDFDPATYGM